MMRNVIVGLCALSLLATAIVVGSASFGPSGEEEAATVPVPSSVPSTLGRQIEPFMLRDFHGRLRGMESIAGDGLLVVAFLGSECPLAKLYGPRLARLAEGYASKGVRFVGIASNSHDSMADIENYAEVHKLKFPILMDLDNVVADQFGAERTPEVFVLDREQKIRYRGRIDDQYLPGVSRRDTSREDLKIALDEMLAGLTVTQPLTEVAGCIIGRVRQSEADGQVTFCNQIVRIFQSHCQHCHRAGEIGPFALTEYSEAVGWAPMIKEVVGQGRMPPWHADPSYGDFANDARLTDEEKSLIFAWVDDGAPEGDPAELPTARQWPEGWLVPDPDMIVPMSEEPFICPAEGVVEYQWYEVDPGFTEDKWIWHAESRPGNRAVVHHVSAYIVPPGGELYLGLNRRMSVLPGYAPGIRPSPPTDWNGVAHFVPAGAKFFFEIHYTPNGSEQTDLSSIALYFADPAKVKRQLSIVAVAQPDLDIPPQTADHQVEAGWVVDEDSLLYALSPHMHLRGKSFRYTAHFPDGREEVLLDVPSFDSNWNTDYVLFKPMRLPERTIIYCVAHFDNSADNTSNPDATQTIHWGQQTWEEMMIGAILIAPFDQDVGKKQGKPPRLAGPE